MVEGKQGKKRSRAPKKVREFVNTHYNPKARKRARLHGNLVPTQTPVDIMAPIIEGLRNAAGPKVREAPALLSEDTHKNAFFRSRNGDIMSSGFDQTFNEAGLLKIPPGLRVETIRPEKFSFTLPNGHGPAPIDESFIKDEYYKKNTFLANALEREAIQTSSKNQIALSESQLKIIRNMGMLMEKAYEAKSPEDYIATLNQIIVAGRIPAISRILTAKDTGLAEFVNTLRDMTREVPANLLAPTLLANAHHTEKDFSLSAMEKYLNSQDTKSHFAPLFSESKFDEVKQHTLLFLKGTGSYSAGNLTFASCVNHLTKFGSQLSTEQKSALQMCIRRTGQDGRKLADAAMENPNLIEGQYVEDWVPDEAQSAFHQRMEELRNVYTSKWDEAKNIIKPVTGWLGGMMKSTQKPPQEYYDKKAAAMDHKPPNIKSRDPSKNLDYSKVEAQRKKMLRDEL